MQNVTNQTYKLKPDSQNKKLSLSYFSNLTLHCLDSRYHKPVSAVTSKRRRCSRSGLSKMEDLPEQEDKRSISKISKKQSSQFMKKLTVNNKEKIITKSPQQAFDSSFLKKPVNIVQRPMVGASLDKSSNIQLSRTLETTLSN